MNVAQRGQAWQKNGIKFSSVAELEISLKKPVPNGEKAQEGHTY